MDEQPDRSPEAKDAAIASLKLAEPGIHFDTACNILRANPAFDADSSEDRVYIMQHWAAVKPAEAEPTEST